MTMEDEWNCMISDMEKSELCVHYKVKESLEEKVERLEKEVERLKMKIDSISIDTRIE